MHILALCLERFDPLQHLHFIGEGGHVLIRYVIHLLKDVQGGGAEGGGIADTPLD